MPANLQVFAGDCTVSFEGDRTRTLRGYVVVVRKPDDTVLVHDSRGYQPASWLTRADDVTVESEGDGFALTARSGEKTLRVVSNVPTGRREFPISEAGTPVGDCPDCADALVRFDGEVACLGCGERYGLPADATVLDERCGDCGLPLFRVQRGAEIECCLDYRCESLTDAVREELDGRWDCPDCGSPLGVVDYEGRTFLGCESYPECETTFTIPHGVVVDDCPCGLPVFETATGRRCLDGSCERDDGGGGDGGHGTGPRDAGA